MSEVIQVIDCDLDLIDEDGISHYVVTARIADVHLVRPEILYPSDRAMPAEYGPGTCSAGFSLDLEDEKPPADTTALRQYIQDLNLDWELDDED